MKKNNLKSFSELWEEAEDIAASYYQDVECSADYSFEKNMTWVLQSILDTAVKEILDKDKNISNEEAYKTALGRILFDLAFLSKTHDINVYTALGHHILSKKDEVLEKTLGGEADLFRGRLDSE